mgnify:FL=1
MSRYWKAALPFLLAAVIILAAASRPVVLHIGFPCDSYWNVPGENYYTFIDAAIEKFEAEHPNVKVEYTSGIRVEDYTEWLSGQYLLGQEPAFTRRHCRPEPTRENSMRCRWNVCRR